MENTHDMNTETAQKQTLHHRLQTMLQALADGKIDSATCFILCTSILEEYPQFPELQNKLAKILLDVVLA